MKYIAEQIEIPKIGMTFSRELMPQIDSNKLDDYLQYLSDQNIQYVKQKLPASELKATQLEFDKDKVAGMLNTKLDTKPIIVSNDGYILDGHHRWLADYNKDKNATSHCVVANLPILELMRVSKYFGGVKHRPVMESVKSIVRKSVKERYYK